MNAGKRRKMQKRNFILKRVLENKQALENKEVVLEESEKVLEEVIPTVPVVEEVVQPVEIKSTKKKKTV
jgi:hypothetical protein